MKTRKPSTIKTPIVYLDVNKNEKQTRYITPDGREVDRVSRHKKPLDDPWKKYMIGIYRGRDLSFDLLSERRGEIFDDLDFHAIFKEKMRQSRQKTGALEKGRMFHDDIAQALQEEDIKSALKSLLHIPVGGEKRDISFENNIFAEILLSDLEEGWNILLYERSFIYEDRHVRFGGTWDLILFKKEGSQMIYKIVDWKTSERKKEMRYDEVYLEYGMQMAAYRKGASTFLHLPDQEILCELIWEDQERVAYPSQVLDSLYQQFTFNILYEIRSTHNLDLIKQMRIKTKSGEQEQ